MILIQCPLADAPVPVRLKRALVLNLLDIRLRDKYQSQEAAFIDIGLGTVYMKTRLYELFTLLAL
jgi:hypothetical protein